ncbi:MAG: hypothetical protein Q9P44_13530, partial [Anaerolineae bacterium]|nr:hypothetical protein [Anaerolineae bacterium]
IITYQMFRYWRSDFKQLSSFSFFYFWGLAQVASFFIILIGSQELNDPLIIEMGYVDNFINSALFIAMFYRREKLQGQSIYIALSKMIGTAAVSGMWLIFPWPGTDETLLMPFLLTSIFVLDLTYTVLVYRQGREMGIDVWRRW